MNLRTVNGITDNPYDEFWITDNKRHRRSIYYTDDCFQVQWNNFFLSLSFEESITNTNRTLSRQEETLKHLLNKRDNIRLSISNQTYHTGNEAVHGTALKPTLAKASSGQECRTHENRLLDTRSGKLFCMRKVRSPNNFPAPIYGTHSVH